MPSESLPANLLSLLLDFAQHGDRKARWNRTVRFVIPAPNGASDFDQAVRATNALGARKVKSFSMDLGSMVEGTGTVSPQCGTKWENYEGLVIIATIAEPLFEWDSETSSDSVSGGDAAAVEEVQPESSSGDGDGYLFPEDERDRHDRPEDGDEWDSSSGGVLRQKFSGQDVIRKLSSSFERARIVKTSSTSEDGHVEGEDEDEESEDVIDQEASEDDLDYDSGSNFAILPYDMDDPFVIQRSGEPNSDYWKRMVDGPDPSDSNNKTAARSFAIINPPGGEEKYPYPRPGESRDDYSKRIIHMYGFPGRRFNSDGEYITEEGERVEDSGNVADDELSSSLGEEEYSGSSSESPSDDNHPSIVEGYAAYLQQSFNHRRLLEKLSQDK